MKVLLVFLFINSSYAQIIEKNCFTKSKLKVTCSDICHSEDESKGILDKRCEMLFHIRNEKSGKEDIYLTRNMVPASYCKLMSEVINKHTIKNNFCLYGDRHDDVNNQNLVFYAIRAGKFCHEWFIGDCKRLYQKMKNIETLNVSDL